MPQNYKNPNTENEKEKQEKEKKPLLERILLLLAIIIIIILLLLQSCGKGKDTTNVLTPTPTPEETVMPTTPTEIPVITEEPETTIVPVEDPTTLPTPTQGIILDIDDGEAWDGNTQTNFAEEEVEYTTIPGFTDIVVNKKNQEIQLYNLPENTVYFIYTITNLDTNEVVYTTKAIEPGKATKWNVYETFGTGVYNISIEISTYDVVTQEQCYGARQTVTAIVQ